MNTENNCLKNYKKYQMKFSSSEFQNYFDHPFLLFEEASENDPENQNSFETLCIRQDQLAKLMEQTINRTASSKVIKLTKKGTNSFQGTVKIGRTGNCDMVINSPAISKLHAYVTRDNQSGTYYLMDMDSKNGTYLKNRKLEPNQKKPLVNGDTISFSRQINFIFYTPEGCYELLNQIP